MARKPLTDSQRELRSIIANNLKRITHGLTQAQISEKTGIPVTTLSGYLTEKSTISGKNTEIIAEAFEVEKGEIDPRYGRNYNFTELKQELIDQLYLSKNLKGKEKSDNFVDLAKKANEKNISVANMVTDRGNNIIALYHDTHDYNYFDTAVSAGIPNSVEAFEQDHIEQIAFPDFAMGKYAGCTDIFFTKINGDSMNNIIPDQSLIAVKRIDSFMDLEDNDIIVFSNSNEFSIKRFINDEKNKRVIFRPDSNNISFTDIVISYDDATDLKIYGKVIYYGCLLK